MVRQILNDKELEQGRLSNNHAMNTALSLCFIVTIYVIALIICVLLISLGIFIIGILYQYYDYLLENKDKLFILLEFIASHSISIIIGATPFAILWQKGK